MYSKLAIINGGKWLEYMLGPYFLCIGLSFDKTLLVLG